MPRQASGLRQKPGLPAQPLWTSHSFSPLVDQGRVVFHMGGNDMGTLSAFDVNTGEAAWTWNGDGPGYGSPMWYDFAGTRQIVTMTQQKFIGLDAATGRLLWARLYTTEYAQNIITPVRYGDTLIVSGYQKPMVAFRVTRQNAQWNTEQVWENADLSLYMSDAVLAGETLVGFSQRRSGQFFGVDARTGKTLWTSDARQGTNAAIVNAGDFWLALKDNGEMLVLRKDATVFEPLRRYEVAKSATWAQPVVSGSRVFVKDVSTLTLWTFNSATPGRITSAPMAGFASKERSAPARRRRCGTWCGRPWKKPASSSTTRRYGVPSGPLTFSTWKSNPVFRAAGSDCTLRAIDRLLGGQAWTRPSDWGAFFHRVSQRTPMECARQRLACSCVGLRRSARAAERPEGSCHVRRRRAARRRNAHHQRLAPTGLPLVCRTSAAARGESRGTAEVGTPASCTCARCAPPVIPPSASIDSSITSMRWTPFRCKCWRIRNSRRCHPHAPAAASRSANDAPGERPSIPDEQGYSALNGGAMFSVAPGVRAVIAASVLAAVVLPAAAQPAGPLVPGLTPEQIQASQALAPKFDRSAEMEQARQTTFKDRPLGAIVQKSFNAFANYLIVSAQMMPEPGYAFRPTPDVRTFGEQINHATGANYSFCNQVGVPPGFNRRSAPGLQARTSEVVHPVGALEASIADRSSRLRPRATPG